jgi:MtrB/PioB family decaheme-associated outer membrane protein
MKKHISILALILFWPVAGFTAETNFSVTPGVQIVDVDSLSSKFSEYRDMDDDGFYLYDLGLDSEVAPELFLDLKGKNVGRDDQTIFLSAERYGQVEFSIQWDEIQHTLSNKAQTPYNNQGGLFTVPATVPLTVAGKNLVPAAAQQVINDGLTETYLDTYLHPVDLGNDRKKGTAMLAYSLSESLKLRLTASNEDREGNKISYGPIGDRPPRTLNIQFTEPIDYRTQELKFDVEYVGKKSQANFSYFLSKFDNEIDSLRWQNIYTDPSGGAVETWDRPVATYGERPLPQDNLYQNFSFAFGLDLPHDSRFTATASYGLAEQDEPFIPYSTISTVDVTSGMAWNDPAKLPSISADAKVETWLLNLDYNIKPIDHLTLRPFYRYYGLENSTPTQDWRYVTSDVVTNAAGSVTYLNKRRNLAYEYNKHNGGVDGTYDLPFWKSVLGLAYEREEVNRDFREADTGENLCRVTLRSRPTNWLNFRTKYLHGDREADTYDAEAAHGSYWYPASEASDNSDSQFTFENHPDTRRADVTDRERDQFDFLASMSPHETVDVSVSYRIRLDDFDSNVSPSQPLLHYEGARVITSADRNAFSPGDQVGLLEDERQYVGLDITYNPTDRWRFGAFASYEYGDTLQRGFEFDENNKATPTAIAAGTELGPWTRKSMQWLADIEDTTTTIGAGIGYEIIPGKLNFSADYRYTAGKIKIDYSGFGTQSSVNPDNFLADNYQFGFRSPPAIRDDRNTFNTGLEYQANKSLVIRLGYTFEHFKIRDWQQEYSTPWFEGVAGNEFLLRDTSQSSQWGNRLPNLGSYLAPSYESHVVMLTATYSF